MIDPHDGPATPSAPTGPPDQISDQIPAPAPASPMHRLRRAAPLIVLGVGAAAGAIAFGDKLDFATLRDNRDALVTWRDAHYLLAALGYMATYVAVVAFSLPGALIMTLTGGFLFGLTAGGLLTLVGATLGAVAIFLAARSGLGDRLAARMDASGGTMARIKRGIEANQVSFLLLMRLVPAVPFFVANLAPAFFGVPLRIYALTTFFGIMPGTLVYTWVGAGLGEVFARGEDPDLGILFTPNVLGPLAALCALAALPMVIKAVRGRTSPGAPPAL
ncbi:MAG: putative membrane protein YdjX (TVP38/TMEM64 family) [Paracoccaceae bacterium]|jgi:uncharacterized membrane protein YdjX (TVP38/TMEM64 family)